jgi:tetratricopeptide (TPR) repeat protein
MRRAAICFLSALTLATACSKDPDPVAVQIPSDQQPAAVKPSSIGAPLLTDPVPASAATLPPVLAPVVSKQDQYDAALLDALNLVADRKYAAALPALQQAKSIQDTEQIRQEIDKVQRLLDAQIAADQTVRDIQTVLAQGKPEQAAQLAAVSLKQFGGAEVSLQFASLKRQADALVAVQIDDQNAKKTRFREEANAAMRDKNFRGAAIAFEASLQFGDDPFVRRQLDDLRTTLTRYDDCRRKAEELRRDPYQLEDALAGLQEAQRAWDTPEVRQEIDEYTLLLQKRRDRISVADFECRGDVGIPFAGRSVAEELLPAFKARFDLVERGHLGRVIDELKLEASSLVSNDDGRREVGRLAKLRYLVVGSISRLGGITVNARIVEVRTGLVVQTAKLVAPSPEALLPQLPQLANILMMSDEQKMAYERQCAQQTAVVIAPVEFVPLLPPPVVVPGPPPPPIVVYTPRPPAFGAIAVEQFDRLPPPPPAGTSVDVSLTVEKDGPFKQRMLQVAIQLGDNLFARGRYAEANKHFELALNLSPEHKDIRLRLEQCRPLLPPPPPVLVVAPPPPPLPRVAVLDFAVFGEPVLVNSGVGGWTADNLAPYFTPPFETVDRGCAYWYMARLGMTYADLLTDPSARRWLGRALGLRYFVLGTVREVKNGWVITTHLLDAEYGYQQGAAQVVATNPYDLKIRLAELARLTVLPPQERLVAVREAENCQSLLVEAREHSDRGEFTVALEIYGRARKLRPNSIEIDVLFDRTDRLARQAALEDARRHQWERQQALAFEFQRQQQELVRQAEAARLMAIAQANVQADAERRAREQAREQAYNQLFLQGQLALRQQNFALSIQLLEGANNLKRTEAAAQQLAFARAQVEQAAQVRAAQEAAVREAQLRQQREAELAQARVQLEAERQRREAEVAAVRRAQETRDRDQYTKLLDQAQRQSAQQKYDAAVAALQTAKQLQKTDEVDRLLSQALMDQARAKAQAQGAAQRAELEKQLAAEQARRQQAEAEAKRNQDLYHQALVSAQQAMNEKRYDAALVKYQEAGKVFRTDVVLNGVRAAEEAKARASSVAVAPKPGAPARVETPTRPVTPPAPLTPPPSPKIETPAKPATPAAPPKIDPPVKPLPSAPANTPPKVESPSKPNVPITPATKNDTAPKVETPARPGLPSTPVPPKTDVPTKPLTPTSPPKLDPPPKPLPSAPPPATTPPPAKPAIPPATNTQTEYAKQMALGATYDKEKKYAEAFHAYQEALKHQPGDAKAGAAIKLAAFNYHLAEGRKLFAQKKNADAAKEFDEALKIVPENAEAKAALKQARGG